LKSAAEPIHAKPWNLKKAPPGQILSLGSMRPTEGLRQAVTDFIAMFNQMKQSLKGAQAAACGTNALHVLDRQLSAFVKTSLTSDPAVSKLTDIGSIDARIADGSVDWIAELRIAIESAVHAWNEIAG
jgi:hypothetical protein